jgi:hypothetical protein
MAAKEACNLPGCGLFCLWGQVNGSRAQPMRGLFGLVKKGHFIYYFAHLSKPVCVFS